MERKVPSIRESNDGLVLSIIKKYIKKSRKNKKYVEDFTLMDLCGRIEFTAGWKKPCPPHPHGEGPVLQFSKGGVSHPLSQGLDDGQTQAGILPGTHLVRGIEALKDLIEASQEGLQRLPAGDVAGRPPARSSAARRRKNEIPSFPGAQGELPQRGKRGSPGGCTSEMTLLTKASPTILQEIEGKLSCNLSRKSGIATFSTVSAPDRETVRGSALWLKKWDQAFRARARLPLRTSTCITATAAASPKTAWTMFPGMDAAAARPLPSSRQA